MKNGVIIIVLIIICSIASFAQSTTGQTYNLDTLIVKSSLQKRLNTNQVSIISPIAVGNAEGLPFADLLNTEAGVFMQNGTQSTNRLTIRGMGSRSQYSTRGIHITLNSIPISSTDGFSIIEDFPLSFVNSLSLVKGPSSGNHGNGFGGSISIKSTSASNKTEIVSLNTLVSPWNTSNLNANINLTKGNKNILIGLNSYNSDGYRENSNIKRSSYFIHPTWVFNKNHQLKASLFGTQVKAFIPSSINLSDFKNAPHKAAVNWLEAKGFEEYQSLINGFEWDYSNRRNLKSAVLVFGKYNNGKEHRPFNNLDFEKSSYGVKNKLDYRFSSILLSGGVEFIRDKFSSNTYQEDYKSEGQRTTQDLLSSSAFGELVYSTQKLLLSAAANFSLFRNIYKPSLSDQVYSTQNISPLLNIHYRLNKSNHIHASVGSGFSVPAEDEIIRSDGQILKDLKPETGYQAELGWQSHQQKQTFSINLYYIRLNDLLSTKRESESVFYSINSGEANYTGIELANNCAYTKGSYSIRTQQTLSYSENRFIDYKNDGINYSGNMLPGIPEYKYSLSTDISYKQNLRFHFNYLVIGKQFLNDANSASYAGYNVLNAKAYQTIINKKQFRLNAFIGVNNILNQHYAGMVLINAPSFNNKAPRYYYPGLPSYIYGGVNLKI